MLKYLLLLFIVVYIVSIISYISKIVQINTCLEVLIAFLKSGRFSPYGDFIKSENFISCQNKLLSVYPKILKFSNEYDPLLSYDKDPVATYVAASELYNSLRMAKNFLVNDLYSSFNPVSAVKKAANFPSILLAFFGFHPSVYPSRIFNLIGWISAYLLGMYQDEIKLFISSLLKQL